MEQVFSNVLDMSTTASIIILVVIAARFFLKKAPKVISYGLWAVVLFRLLCPVSFAAPVSLLEITQPTVTLTSAQTSTISYLPEITESRLEPSAEASGQSITLPASPQPTPNIRENLKGWISLLWAAGAACMVLCCLASWFRLSRLLIGAVPYRGRAYLADHIPTPFVMGIFKPKIYIPSGTPQKERSYILAHEEHHIRRFDHIVKLLAWAALCIHWFNPLVWLAFFLSGNDMEMSCDEAVIRTLDPVTRAAYAESLLRLGANRPAMSGIPLAFCEGDTKMRVKNIVKWKPPKAWVVLLSLLLCAALLVACAVNPSQKEDTVSSTEAPVDADTALEACRTALETLQSMDSYSAEIQTYNYGEQVLNDTSAGTYCQSGNDWLYLSSIPDEGFDRGYAQFGYLFTEGSSYNNLQTGWDENQDILWGKVEANPQVRPWVAEFQWDAQEVSFVSLVPAGDGQCITLQVMGPYYAHKPDTTQQPYQVQFIFDRQGTLTQIENTVYLHRDSLGEYSIREITQFPSGSAKGRIQEAYQKYLDAQ